MAVLGVIAFHTGLSSVPGGFYGVDAFFVLSGFLITSLLITEWQASGTIRLGRFWAGRARRLLPALFVLVAVIGIVMACLPRLLATPHIISDAVSTVLYASNWYSIHNGISYFTANASPSPLLHTWSLAIEEQFYLAWPLIVLAVLRVGAGPGRRARQRTVPVLEGGQLTMLPRRAAREPEWTRRRRVHLLFALSAFGAVASAVWMAVLAPDGYTTRAYYGTDTRVQALLVGAAIAAGLVVWKEGSQRTWFRRFGAVLGLIGIVGSGVLWALTNEASVFAFSGGFLVASMLAGMVVLGAAVAPRGPAAWVLELPPLPALGRISYGVYLWYWPVLLVMSGSRLHWGVYPLFAARVAVTVTVAALSNRFIELPIRRGALPSWRSLVAAPVSAGLAVGLVMLSTLVPVGAASLQGSTVVTTTTTTPGETTTTGVSALAPPVSTSPPTSTPTTPTGSPIKVLLVGDSIAGSLGVGLSEYEANDNLQIVNEGIPGCSLSMDQRIKVLFYTLSPGAPCDPKNSDALFEQWQKWVDAYNPDVVVYAARGETFDQEVDGQYSNLGVPAFDRYVEQRYRQAVSILGSRGASVVLMTSPYYDSGTSPAGTPWPEDAPSRVQIDNQIIRDVADTETTEDGHPVYVFNLNLVVSPDNAYTSSINGINLRCADGVHFSSSGGVFVGLQLLPDLAALGQAHATASPGGAWPGHLPASTPKWFTDLNC